jgi:hypothetical protein
MIRDRASLLKKDWSAEAVTIALDNGQGSPVLTSRGADMI